MPAKFCSLWAPKCSTDYSQHRHLFQAFFPTLYIQYRAPGESLKQAKIILEYISKPVTTINTHSLCQSLSNGHDNKNILSIDDPDHTLLLQSVPLLSLSLETGSLIYSNA